MTDFDYGPLQTYEITWKTGHTECIQAHQISWPNNMQNALEALGVKTKTQRDPRVVFHADLDGRWTLMLSALLEDIRTIRNVLTEDVNSALWGTEAGESK